MTMGKGVKNCWKLRDVIYGEPLTSFLEDSVIVFLLTCTNCNMFSNFRNVSNVKTAWNGEPFATVLPLIANKLYVISCSKEIFRPGLTNG